MDVMSADQPPVLKSIDVPNLGKHGERVEMFIDCWTHMFMCIAIVLKVKVDNIAEAGEYLKLCLGLGVTDVLKGGRRRRHHRGGAGEELVGLTFDALQKLGPPSGDSVGREQRSREIAKLRETVSLAKTRALARFQEAPTLAKRLVRLLWLFGVALLPIGSKLAEIGLEMQMEQARRVVPLAAATAIVQTAGFAGLDAALTAIDAVDQAFANVGQAAVEGASAAGNAAASAAETANTRIQDAVGAVGRAAAAARGPYPGVRGVTSASASASRMQRTLDEIVMQRKWEEDAEELKKLQDYHKLFNVTILPVLQQQPPGSSGTAVQKLLKDTSEPQEEEEEEVPASREPIEQVIEEAGNKLRGFRNYMSSRMAYALLAGHLFAKDTITYLYWSNTVAVILFGIIMKDPATIGLCILWVIGSLGALSWITPFIEAWTTKAGVETALKLIQNSPAALKLETLEAEQRAEAAERAAAAAERAANAYLQPKAPALAALAGLASPQVALADAAPTQGALTDAAAATPGGRRRATSRRYRRASGPRRTRRSSSGRRRGYSRRRRE